MLQRKTSYNVDLSIRETCSLKFFVMLFSQAEHELRVAQTEFDRQAEVTRLLVEGISSTHVSSAVFTHNTHTHIYGHMSCMH